MVEALLFTTDLIFGNSGAPEQSGSVTSLHNSGREFRKIWFDQSDNSKELVRLKNIMTASSKQARNFLDFNISYCKLNRNENSLAKFRKLFFSFLLQIHNFILVVPRRTSRQTARDHIAAVAVEENFQIFSHIKIVLLSLLNQALQPENLLLVDCSA